MSEDQHGGDKVEPDDQGKPEHGSERFKHLPEPIMPEDTVASQDTRVPRDPEDGRDTDRDFMIRYSGG
jgi:hypothetical protein